MLTPASARSQLLSKRQKWRALRCLYVCRLVDIIVAKEFLAREVQHVFLEEGRFVLFPFFDKQSLLGPFPGSQNIRLNPRLGDWEKELQTLVKSFHAKNLVHGDLRYPSIICNGEKVMIVDFDWAEKGKFLSEGSTCSWSDGWMRQAII